jgi:RNA polymerase sigma-70 factor (ECF subfamily)
MQDDFEQLDTQSQATAEYLRLFAANQARLFGYLLTLLPQWHDAEEILQETSVVLWRSFDQFEPGTNFLAWARTIAFHQVLNFRKRNKRRAMLFSDDFFASVAAESDDMADSLEEQLQTMSECMKGLPSDHRRLIGLCYQPNVTTQQVAEQLGRPAGTVYKTLTRIRRTLMECIERTLSQGERR